jgi:signal transduction histidine kinase
MEQLELSGVIDAAVEISQPLLQKNSVQLVLKLPDQPIRVDGDRVRLAQIFANLLNNAAKYTQAGGSVSLTASEVGSEAVVRVKDSGIGIPAEMLSAVFDMFAHVDRSLNRSHVGLGIGLAMVAHLVQMHGGTVEAFSDGQGCGAEFVVRLPLRSAPEGKPAVVA